jgi:hypothetical protein
VIFSIALTVTTSAKAGTTMTTAKAGNSMTTLTTTRTPTVTTKTACKIIYFFQSMKLKLVFEFDLLMTLNDLECFLKSLNSSFKNHKLTIKISFYLKRNLQLQLQRPVSFSLAFLINILNLIIFQKN